MSLWDKAWPGPSIRLGQPLGAAPLDNDARVPLDNLPISVLANTSTRIPADTSEGSYMLPLPPSPAVGNSREIFDPNGSWPANPLTITGSIADSSGNPFADGLLCRWSIPMRFACRTAGIWTLES